ncbi:gamma-butyrobetaine hydroxylase-like domain-containing protein [Anderseniella sp. Alg231-50]|uniref:gamma-butyrobetaine hydroxylase-like domain-containing protein n=1 Tax=Anderseniella sp. Alg231-50 TaxID=1922226 RepID=UPI000D55C668
MTETSNNTTVWVEEIRLSDAGRSLNVTFDDGEKHSLSAEYLRVESPSAEVQGHSADQKTCVGGKAGVAIIKIDPVGNYAVRLTFDDMHSTGIFSWDYLLKLGRDRDVIWSAYLERLEAEGKSRT